MLKPVSYKVLFGITVFIILLSFFSVFFLGWYDRQPLQASVGLEKVSQKEGEKIKLAFVGDIMLDRYIAKYIEGNGFGSLVEGVRQTLAGNDLIVGNLEGTFTDSESISKKDLSVLRFTFDPNLAASLKRIGFGVFSLANNHSFDFGRDGFEETTGNLDKNGIQYFGSPNNDLNISKKIEIKGKKLCFVGYHDLYTYDEAPVLREIENIRRNCDYIFLFAHWGEEYKGEATERQKELAHKFVDAGADVIIGAHPHVVEPVEIYKNRAIFYSLGNLIFDQYFSFETTHGLILKIEISDKGLSFEPIVTKIEGGAVKIAPEDEKLQVLGNTQPFILHDSKDL